MPAVASVPLNTEPSPPAPVWDVGMDVHTQAAIDRILDYIQTQNLVPRFMSEGNPVHVALRLANDMQSILPDVLAPDRDQMVAYLVRWITDYTDQTQTDRLGIDLHLHSFSPDHGNTVVVASDQFQVPLVQTAQATTLQSSVRLNETRVALDLKMNQPGANHHAPVGGAISFSPHDTQSLLFMGTALKTDQVRPLSKRPDIQFLRAHGDHLMTVKGMAEQIAKLTDGLQGAAPDVQILALDMVTTFNTVYESLQNMPPSSLPAPEQMARLTASLATLGTQMAALQTSGIVQPSLTPVVVQTLAPLVPTSLVPTLAPHFTDWMPRMTAANDAFISANVVPLPNTMGPVPQSPLAAMFAASQTLPQALPVMPFVPASVAVPTAPVIPTPVTSMASMGMVLSSDTAPAPASVSVAPPSSSAPPPAPTPVTSEGPSAATLIVAAQHMAPPEPSVPVAAMSEPALDSNDFVGRGDITVPVADTEPTVDTRTVDVQPIVQDRSVDNTAPVPLAPQDFVVPDMDAPERLVDHAQPAPDPVDIKQPDELPVDTIIPQDDVIIAPDDRTPEMVVPPQDKGPTDDPHSPNDHDGHNVPPPDHGPGPIVDRAPPPPITPDGPNHPPPDHPPHDFDRGDDPPPPPQDYPQWVPPQPSEAADPICPTSGGGVCKCAKAFNTAAGEQPPVFTPEELEQRAEIHAAVAAVQEQMRASAAMFDDSEWTLSPESDGSLGDTFNDCACGTKDCNGSHTINVDDLLAPSSHEDHHNGGESQNKHKTFSPEA